MYILVKISDFKATVCELWNLCFVYSRVALQQEQQVSSSTSFGSKARRWELPFVRKPNWSRKLQNPSPSSFRAGALSSKPREPLDFFTSATRSGGRSWKKRNAGICVKMFQGKQHSRWQICMCKETWMIDQLSITWQYEHEVKLLSFPVLFCSSFKVQKSMLILTLDYWSNMLARSFCLYLAVLKLEAVEAYHAQYLPQLGDMARVVNGHGQHDEPEMAFKSVIRRRVSSEKIQCTTIDHWCQVKRLTMHTRTDLRICRSRWRRTTRSCRPAEAGQATGSPATGSGVRRGTRSSAAPSPACPKRGFFFCVEHEGKMRRREQRRYIWAMRRGRYSRGLTISSFVAMLSLILVMEPSEIRPARVGSSAISLLDT